VERAEAGAVVRGKLYEPATGAPVANAEVVLQFDDQTIRVRANERGEFEHTFPDSPGAHDISVSFPGGRHHAETHFEQSGFDLARQPTTIALGIGTRPAGGPGTPIRIRTTSRGSAISVPVVAQGGPLGAPPRDLGSLSTDADGNATLLVGAGDLGGPGRKTIQISFAGDVNRDASRESVSWVLRASTVLSLLGPETAHDASTLTLRGALEDEFGSGIPNAPIAVFANGTRLAGAVTSKAGAYSLALPARELVVGKSAFHATFDSGRSWLDSTRSQILSINITPTPPVPAGYLVAAFALAALTLLLYILIRRAPWRAWARQGGQGPDPLTRPARGLAKGRPRVTGALATHRTDLRGHIQSSRRAPLAGATVTVSTPAQRYQASSTADGTFALMNLPPGTHQAMVVHPGYVAEMFPVSIPHRGSLIGVTITLVEIREHVFDRYRETVTPYLPTHPDPAVWTPREVVRHVRTHFQAPALTALTDLVEIVFFSGIVPKESDLESAEHAVTAARVELESRHGLTAG